MRRASSELWICYSTISYYLFQAWLKEYGTQRNGHVCIAPSSPLHTVCDHHQQYARSHPCFKQYGILTFIQLIIRSVLSGRKLKIRIPHFNPPIFNKTLNNLVNLKLVEIQLYDDGFLGLLEHPSVLKYIRPVIDSIVHWNISGWRLSSTICFRLQLGRISSIATYPVSCRQLVDNLRGAPRDHQCSNTFILESKYMDYRLLADLLQKYQLHLPLGGIPYYFQHPWHVKRNSSWPIGIKRTIVSSVALEAHIIPLINSKSHIISAMTSSVVLFCELAKQGLVPQHKITLLLSEPNQYSEYQTKTEIYSYINHVTSHYTDVVDLKLWLNGIPYQPS